MVWEKMETLGRRAPSWNRWPPLHNWVKDIRTLVCDDQTMLVQVKLAFALSMEMFFTNFLPSPREVERKFFTGGYRCGHILNVPLKSPVEILFGKGTNTIIAEIARPAVTALYYFWLQQTTITALSMFTTLIYPMAFCEENIGDAYRRNDRASLGGGHIEGVPGLGVLIFDYYDICTANAAIASFPPGYWSVTAVWVVNPSPWPTTNLVLGIRDLGGIDYFEHFDDQDAGFGQQWISNAGGYSDDNHTVEAWMSGDKPLDAFPQLITCVIFTASWSPVGPPVGTDNLMQPMIPTEPWAPPHCGMDFL